MAGCGGSKSKTGAPPVEQAQGFADDFVRKLVAGRWEAVADDVAPLLTREARHFQDSIRRDGIRELRGPGVLRHDCPPSPAVDAGSDCFVYRLAGRQVVPIKGEVALKARYRLWVAHEDGRWQVINYEYDLIPR
ncbi:MAG: hypothetical protein AABM30_10555 [Actinomycetota bacterium]